ncbi:MAG: hypothetical protein QNJ54_09215 [Prochloraceae cyanobacterium]|nr:hypothetical protein [Prochloraceae cyanobacterium]
MSNTQKWYIVKKKDGRCEILSWQSESTFVETREYWGPFASSSEAIARRVGLIRAFKCKPL